MDLIWPALKIVGVVLGVALLVWLCAAYLLATDKIDEE